MKPRFTRRDNITGQAATTAKIDLESKLFFGFSNLNIAATAQSVQPLDQAKCVPVSTRAIGFYVQSIFTKIQQLYSQLPECTAYDAYRVSLAQFEMRMIALLKTQRLPTNVDRDTLSPPALTIQERDLIEGHSINFGPISSLLNSLGNFEFCDTNKKIFSYPH